MQGRILLRFSAFVFRPSQRVTLFYVLFHQGAIDAAGWNTARHNSTKKPNRYKRLNSINIRNE